MFSSLKIIIPLLLRFNNNELLKTKRRSLLLYLFMYLNLLSTNH
jgi:hypothetical protein